MAFLAGYNRRKSITVDADTYITGNLTDQTIVVHLDNGESDFWNNTPPAAGTGVRFTSSDGTTLLKFQVESYDTTGDDGWWHIKIPTLSSSVDTVIYIYYDADSESDGSDKEGTWNSDIDFACHHNEDQAEGRFDDATSNNNNLTNSGSISVTDLIDKASDFDGTDDLLSASSAASINYGTGDFCFEAVIRPDVVNVNSTIISKQTDPTTTGWFGRVTSSAKAQFVTSVSAVFTIVTGSTSLSADTAYHIMGGRVGTVHTIYVNGVLDGTTDDTARNVNTSTDMEIGIRSATVQPFNGTIDETLLLGIGPTLDMAKARYQSYLGTWLTIGATEIPPTGGIVVLRRRIEEC